MTSLLARASHLASKRFYQALKRHGIPVREWRVLAALSDNDGMALGELAEIILVEQSSTSRLIERMAERGLVERTTLIEDNRKTVVFITPKGYEQVKGLVKQAVEIDGELVELIDAKKSAKLKNELLGIINLLNEAD